MNVKQKIPLDKEFVKFCNSLRCPLCGSQLDGMIYNKKSRLYCVQDNNEYSVIWRPNETLPDHEMITYTYSQYQYVINYGADFYTEARTIITRYNMDAAPMYRNSTAKEVFRCNGRLSFFRKRLEEDAFLNKLKTYQVFS